MKQYKRIWLISFLVSLAVMSLVIFAFMIYMKENSAKPTATPSPSDNTEVNAQNTYIEPQDNVGAVSFTEDQMTELARKLFSLDGFINDLSLDFGEEGITISARIKDKEKLLESYPELVKFNTVLDMIEKKKMTVKGTVANSDGRAAIKIESVTVDGARIDGEVISPFVEDNEFSSLFDVEYENIEIAEGEVVFKNGVPDILKY